MEKKMKLPFLGMLNIAKGKDSQNSPCFLPFHLSLAQLRRSLRQ